MMPTLPGGVRRLREARATRLPREWSCGPILHGWRRSLERVLGRIGCVPPQLGVVAIRKEV